ncbi:hypothetical protein V2W45_1490429 [Cenococcum geophilum]
MRRKLTLIPIKIQLRQKGYTYKRAKDPPRNAQNKMIYKFKECANITFKRKCEWSKHMDKYNRPYKYHARGCEKLQGFTYSGGLLRHKREVYKLHRELRSLSSRGSRAEFTQKENLAEYIRRVYRRVSPPSGVGLLGLKRGDERDEREDVELREEPRKEEWQGDDSVLGRRKRISDAGELINNGEVGDRDEGDLK